MASKPANGPRKLGQWEHEKSGIVIEYFIEHTTFKCTVLEEKLEAPDATVLQHKAFDKIEHWMNMTWHPVIDVTCAEGERRYSYRDEPEGESSASVKIEANRFWLSRSPAGRMVMVEWDVEEEHRKAKLEKYGGTDIQLTRLPLKAPFKFKEDSDHKNGGRWLIDYDESIWSAIEQMIEAINSMRKNLVAMFKTKEGVTQLQSAGARLLLAASTGTASPAKQIGAGSPTKKGGK
jgi:hypothetical protein